MFLFNFDIDNYYILIIIIIKVYLFKLQQSISKNEIEVRLLDMHEENCF